jgi:uncharacterized protein YndB with AHSA1/START domain
MTREGTLIHIEGRPALRFERRYRHPMERVWRAITDPDELRQWFPSDVVGDRAVGAELVFDDDAQRAEAQQAGEPTRADGPMFRGVVVAHDPPKVFSFTWGGELLRFELLPEGNETVLVFTHLLSDQSVAARNGSGWHMCLAELDRLLDASETGAPDDWMPVYEDYLHRVGPALGVPSVDGAMTWQRAIHVDADRVRAATTDPAELEAWGAGGRSAEPLHWDIEPEEHGATYYLTHDAIGADAELAAAWHALLLQLDMYLAAGQLVPVDHEHWIDAYDAVL